jgi:hypothetical protein
MMNYLEIPLAILSFCFYRVMKFLIGNLYTLSFLNDSDKASRWRVLCGEKLRSPLSVPVLMTKGPRWNTHAIIGTLGPFTVKEAIEVSLQTLRNSAKSWILVIYRFPSYETMTNLDSNQIDSSEEWISIPLETGRYTIGLRYYDRTPPIIFPTVRIDHQSFAESLSVPENTNEFYPDLIKRKNWFYLALHYYIFTLLKYRQFLPETFVRGEYLPVGAPDTEFVYDRIEKGRSLHLEIESSILENFYVFLTLYDRSSFPIDWCQIKGLKYTSQVMKNNSYYLLRLRPRHGIVNGKITSKVSGNEAIVRIH